MIFNNLFLFILLISAKSVSPFLNSTQNQRWIDRFEMGKKCPLLGAHTVCVCFDTSPFTKTSDRSIRLSMGINSKAIFFVSVSVSVCVCRSTMFQAEFEVECDEKKHILMQFSMDEGHKKGKKRFVFN